jgi:hypothetical protein
MTKSILAILFFLLLSTNTQAQNKNEPLTALTEELLAASTYTVSRFPKTMYLLELKSEYHKKMKEVKRYHEAAEIYVCLENWEKDQKSFILREEIRICLNRKGIHPEQLIALPNLRWGKEAPKKIQEVKNALNQLIKDDKFIEYISASINRRMSLFQEKGFTEQEVRKALQGMMP